MTPAKTTAARAPAKLIDRAWAAVPEIVALDELRPVLAERLRSALQARGPGDTGTATARRLLDDVAGGAPLPPDIGSRFLADRDEQARIDAERAVLEQMRDQLRHRRRIAQREGADLALAVVAVELAAVVDDARPVFARLGDVASADAAIEVGGDVPQAWRDAMALAGRYHEVREAQATVTAAELRPLDQPVQPSREVRRLVESFGLVRGARCEPVTQPSLADGAGNLSTTSTKIVGGRVQQTTQTDQPARPPDAFPTGVALEDLRYLVTRDVEAWVPSISELQRAEEDAKDAARRAVEEARQPAPRPVQRRLGRGQAAERLAGRS